MLGYLAAAGYRIVDSPEDARVLIVNTCGFIASAKEESIDAILEMARYKRTGACRVLAATGCLTQRYREELAKELPEVDLLLGVGEYESLPGKLAALLGEPQPEPACQTAARVLTTPPYQAYLRVADGCDNRCSYCAIPMIRGPRASVPMEQLVQEARDLAARGVKELLVIAQDTSGYGRDLYGRPRLAELLRELDRIDQLHWIRLLYTYPASVDGELLDVIRNSRAVVRYLDMPVQHVDDALLRRMNRRGTADHIRGIVDRVRETMPDCILRTTVIVGFPGEGEAEFETLLRFLREHPFGRLGAFAYSPEEGTPAASFPHQVPEAEKARRLDALMRQQQEISLALNRAREGSVAEVLVEGRQGELWAGRSYAEAPDVDGKILFSSTEALVPGAFVNVRLKTAEPYDIFGVQV